MLRIYVHSLPVRIWHWINAAACVMMVLTGIQIRYVGLVNVVPFRIAVTVHNWIAFILIANFFVWFFFYLFSDKIRIYHPELNPMKHFHGTMRQTIYYGYGIFKGDAQSASFEPVPPVQSAAEHGLPDHHAPPASDSVLHRNPALGSQPLCRGGGLLRRSARRRYGARSDLHRFRVLYPVPSYLGTLGRTPIEKFKAMFDGYEEIEEGESAEGAE